MERIGSARVVLLGEATHGTSEFYRMRARITRELIVEKGFQICRHRGGLARRRTRGSLCAAFPISAVGMDGVRTISDLDVAQQRGARLCKLAAQAQRDRGAGTSASHFTASISTASTTSIRSVLELSGRGRSGVGQGRPRALRLPDAMAARPRHLWSCRLDRLVPTCEPEVARALTDLSRNAGPMPSMTASASSMPNRTPGWWRTRSAITGSCTTVRARRGTCATPTCSKL